MMERTASWDKIGVNVMGSKKVQDALDKAGLDYMVDMADVTYTPYGKQILTAPNKKVTYRVDTGEFKGIVGKDYKVCQNRDAFDFVNYIDADMEFTKAGESQNGAIWVIAKFPEMEVLGDKITPHLIFQNGHNGYIGIRSTICMLRVVCQNQFNAAFKDAANTISIKHCGDMDSKLSAARETIKRTKDYISHYKDEAERLSGIKISNQDLQNIIKKMIADEQEVKEGSVSEKKIQYFKECYNADDNSNFIGTGWGVLNAYTDFLTHMPVGRKCENAEDKRFIRSALNNKECDRMLKEIDNIGA